jgi:outer membrane lipoprotein-sorting protein
MPMENLVYSDSSQTRYLNPAIAKEKIKAVRNSLNRIRPFKVNFTQQVYTDNELDLQESGVILFKSDQQLKWIYQDPDFKIFLLDGGKYQFYDEDNEQLIIGKIKDKNQQWIWQLLFSEDLFRDYPVTWDDDLKRFHIKSKSGHQENAGEIGIDIEIIVNESYLPASVIQNDPSGARIVYHFKEYKPKIKIPDDSFQLNVPDDVEIVHE